MSLQADLVGDPPEGGGRPVSKVEVGHERAGVLVPPWVIGVDGCECEECCSGGGDRLGFIGNRQRRMRVVDGDGPLTVRRPVGGHARRPVYRSDLRPGVRSRGGGVEGGVLDVVAHGLHVVRAHGLDVHQRSAVDQPELAVVVIGDHVPEVHELGGRADIDLHPLEDGLHRVALETQRLLHAPGIDGARTPPLFDGDVAHDVTTEGADQMGHAGSVDQVTGQQILGSEPGKLVTAEHPQP